MIIMLGVAVSRGRLYSPVHRGGVEDHVGGSWGVGGSPCTWLKCQSSCLSFYNDLQADLSMCPNCRFSFLISLTQINGK